MLKLSFPLCAPPPLPLLLPHCHSPLPHCHSPLRHMFTTCYMASSNSSTSTRERAKCLAAQIGSTHSTISIDDMVGATTDTFVQSTRMVPKFKVHGGGSAENLALQNVQSRCRMVLSYLYAQLSPWTQGEKGGVSGTKPTVLTHIVDTNNKVCTMVHLNCPVELLNSWECNSHLLEGE